jgi:hypothetical protein
MQVKNVAVDTSSKQKYSSVLRKAGSWEWLQQLLTTLRRWERNPTPAPRPLLRMQATVASQSVELPLL